MGQGGRRGHGAEGPTSVLVLTPARAAISRSTASVKPWLAAICRAVFPFCRHRWSHGRAVEQGRWRGWPSRQNARGPAHARRRLPGAAPLAPAPRARARTGTACGLQGALSGRGTEGPGERMCACSNRMGRGNPSPRRGSEGERKCVRPLLIRGDEGEGAAPRRQNVTLPASICPEP